MLFNFPEIEVKETPKGKRSIRCNVWGNWVGYVSGKRFKEFGVSEHDAVEWLNESN